MAAAQKVYKPVEPNFVERQFFGFMYKTKQVRAADPVQHKDIIDSIYQICHDNNIKVPKKVLICDSNVVNASVWPFSNSINYTSGIIDRMQPNQLKAVTAHELSHFKHRGRDLLASATILIGTALAVSKIWHRAAGQFHQLTHPIAGGMGRIANEVTQWYSGLFALSFYQRHIEAKADKDAIEFTNDPTSFRETMEELQAYKNEQITNKPQSKSASDYVQKYALRPFRTHPKLEDRISFARKIEEEQANQPTPERY